MIECRGIIRDIKKTIKKLENLGGKFKNKYSYTDIIFIPISGKFDLDKEFIRLRIYKENNWPTKDIILHHKKTEWKKEGKISKFILKKEFDNLDKANIFISKIYPERKKGFEYFREGWEYHLGESRFFIENIKNFKPTIEIEVKNKEDLNKLFTQLEIVEKINNSIPAVMRKVFKVK